MSDFEAGQNSIIALIRQWATHQAKIGRKGTNRRYRDLAAKLERERPMLVPMEPQGRAIPLVETVTEEGRERLIKKIREAPVTAVATKKPWWSV